MSAERQATRPRIDPGRLTAWYDFQAPLYRRWRDDYDGELVERVAALCGDADAPLRVLDAGCGTGCFGIGVARRAPGWHVEAVDLSRGMLAEAARQAGKHGVGGIAFRRGDVTSLPYREATFDAVIAAGLFPNVNDDDAVLSELRRVLAPGGRLVVVEFDRASMTPRRRVFFWVMILGYRAVSFVFRRFRFAGGWNIRASTVDRAELEARFARAGFAVVSVSARGDHLTYELTRESDR